ncbi:unnamed protein product [Peronospora destructor]|uniref:GAF domain-containing protein n=1 Tax=Peronospora destructor TaxID=86335 RepID=A0AAV0UCT6_9STRA|nr:unnamed protein product [Peronospora destructor]
MMLQVTSLDAALQLFTTVQDNVTNFAAKSTTKPVVVLYLPQEPDRKQKRELQKLLVPIAFLFRGRDDITLVQLSLSEITQSSLAVFKNRTEVVRVTMGSELKDWINTLAKQIGWSPDCPDETQVHNYLSPINAEELLGTKSVQRIKDVHDFPGHIACDDASESELVVPVLSKQRDVIALIDLDCPQKNGFSAEDERTLVKVARIMADACDWDNVKMRYTQP